MQASVQARLDALRERYTEISALLAEPDVIADRDRYRSLSKEFARLEPLSTAISRFEAVEEQTAETRQMLDAETDPELRELARNELEALDREKDTLERELQLLLLPTDPDDERGVYLEIRAGTGGDEAALFAGDLFRMYARYAERQGWSLEILSSSEGEHGGFKEVIAQIEGDDVYAQLKFESGAHRVQRVPDTESQGRIHTSACTVAVLPQQAEIERVDIDPGELRIDTFRSSGAGGQHVNTTDSAIRITHLPTGTVVECQDERSQHKNRARAMSLLQARLFDDQKKQQQQEQSQTRKLLVGSGDRSQRIRTYNFPQGRVTDHRVNLTLYQLDAILAGELELVVEPLQLEDQAEKLAELATE